MRPRVLAAMLVLGCAVPLWFVFRHARTPSPRKTQPTAGDAAQSEPLPRVRGQANRELVKHLLARLREYDGLERSRTTVALAAFHPDSVPDIVSALASGDVHADDAVRLLDGSHDAIVSGIVGHLRAGERHDVLFDALEVLGPEAAAAVEPLCDILTGTSSENPRHEWLRWQVLQVLTSMGPKAEAAVPTLAPLLSSYVAAHGHERGKWRVMKWRRERHAVWAEGHHIVNVFGRVGPAASTALPAVRSALESQDRHLRIIALWTLGRLGEASVPALEDVAGCLRSDDSGVRCAALQALAGIGPSGHDHLPNALQALNDPSDAVQNAAALAVAGIDPSGEAVVPKLIVTIKERAPGWHMAVKALGMLGAAARDALPVLVQALDDEDMAALVVEALDGLGEEARPSVPALVARLRASHRFFAQSGALDLIAKLNRDALRELVPYLVSKAKADPADHDIWPPTGSRHFVGSYDFYGILTNRADLGLVPGFRHGYEELPFVGYEAAARALAVLGPHAKEAIPALNAMAAWNFEEAARALDKVDPKTPAELVVLLQRGDTRTREWAEEALTRVDRLPPEAARPLLELSDKRIPDALAKVESVPASLAPLLLKRVRTCRPDSAIPALRSLPALLREIRAIRSGERPMERSLLDKALKEVGVGPSEAVALLRQALLEDELRVDAVWALGRFGHLAKPAVAELARLASESDNAARSLRVIRGDT